MSTRAAIPKPSCTTRAASTGTSRCPNRDWPHQGMVKAKYTVVTAATRPGAGPVRRPGLHQRRQQPPQAGPQAEQQAYGEPQADQHIRHLDREPEPDQDPGQRATCQGWNRGPRPSPRPVHHRYGGHPEDHRLRVDVRAADEHLEQRRVGRPEQGGAQLAGRIAARHVVQQQSRDGKRGQAQHEHREPHRRPTGQRGQPLDPGRERPVDRPRSEPVLDGPRDGVTSAASWAGVVVYGLWPVTSIRP
jgi:hypothetical protein